MTEAVLHAVKAIDGTGSTQLLLAGLIPGVIAALMGTRGRRWAVRWLLAAGVVYLLLAVPAVANGLAAPLGATALASTATSNVVDTLVIFDGDNRRGRLQAARDILASSSPTTIWILGTEPDWFRMELPGERIPVELVRYETSTDTTRRQTEWVAATRRDHPGASIAVVVSRLQAARVIGLAGAMQLSGIRIISAPVNREPAESGLWQFVPSGPAWRVSRDALYEHAALFYYRRNGWLAS